MTSAPLLFAASDLSDTGVSAVGTMLIVAGIALVLGIGALLLAHKRKDHHDGPDHEA